MAENEVEKMLDHLRRIKSGGNMTRFMIVEIEKLELVLRVLRTVIKYYHVLLPDPVELTKKAKWTVKELQWVVDECRTIFNLERLESHLLEFFEGNTSLSYNYELNDFDMSKYMDCLGKILNDVQMMFLERCRLSPLEKLEIHQFTKKLKIVQKKMKFLRYLYAAEINGYVNHEKLECLETRIQLMANNVGQFCFSVLAYVAEIEVKDENYIFNTPPYLLSLFVFVELEMKKIFLGELKA